MGEGLPTVSIAKLGSEVGGKGKGKVNDSAGDPQRPCEKKKTLCKLLFFFLKMINLCKRGRLKKKKKEK